MTKICQETDHLINTKEKKLTNIQILKLVDKDFKITIIYFRN